MVIQNDERNESGIKTVLVCPVTSNLRRGLDPGNITLDTGEANLPDPSVVNVSLTFAANKEDLAEIIGRLGPERVLQIVNGLRLFIEPAPRRC